VTVCVTVLVFVTVDGTVVGVSVVVGVTVTVLVLGVSVVVEVVGVPVSVALGESVSVTNCVSVPWVWVMTVVPALWWRADVLGEPDELACVVAAELDCVVVAALVGVELPVIFTAAYTSAATTMTPTVAAATSAPVVRYHGDRGGSGGGVGSPYCGYRPAWVGSE